MSKRRNQNYESPAAIKKHRANEEEIDSAVRTMICIYKLHQLTHFRNYFTAQRRGH